MLSKSRGDHRWRLTCWTKRVSIVELVFCNEFTVFLVIIQNQIPREPGQCFRVSLHKYVTVTLLYSLGPPFSAKTQLWSIETWTQQEFWRCGSKMLAADPLNPVNCEMGPPWMRLVCPSSPTAARLDWDPESQINTLNLLLCSSNHSQTIFAVWQQRPLLLGTTASMKGFS